MPQQNLEQLRVAHAFKESQKLQRKHVVKLPAMILNNGLLSAAAFTLDDKRSEMRAAMEATTRFLQSRQLTSGATVTSLIDDLSKEGRDAFFVQRATSEALAYLSYLKRFATRAADEDESED